MEVNDFQWDMNYIKLIKNSILFLLLLFSIEIHSMQGWTATKRHGVTRKEVQKRLQDTENLFRKNLQSKDVLILDLKPLRS